mmetsp:Transcript_57426/g.95073  ORF Transcript_57426/g.95073 Transcript_57426/m.95073 type:complete len:257 (+) Transcript_57426:1393-2163(+)
MDGHFDVFGRLFLVVRHVIFGVDKVQTGLVLLLCPHQFAALEELVALRLSLGGPVKLLLPLELPGLGGLLERLQCHVVLQHSISTHSAWDHVLFCRPPGTGLNLDQRSLPLLHALNPSLKSLRYGLRTDRENHILLLFNHLLRPLHAQRPAQGHLGVKLRFLPTITLRQLLLQHRPVLLIVRRHILPLRPRKELHIEIQRGVCGNLWRRALISVGVLWRARQRGPLTLLHGLHSLIPASDHAAFPQLEHKRRIPLS